MIHVNNIFDSVAVPVVELDTEFRVVSANKKAQKEFGEIETGGEIWKLFSIKRRSQSNLQHVLDSHEECTLKVSAKQGFLADYLVSINVPESGLTDNQTALILTFEDRTRSQDAKAMRSDFVANVSHEIRSPLTAISGLVETLRGPARDDPEARDAFLALMEEEVRRMSSLVSNLLSLSRVEAKERRLPKQSADPVQVIHEASELVSAFAKKRDKKLTVDCPDSLPVIRGKHDDLVRVLINLLENALTYSKDNSEVTLRADLAQSDNPLGVKALYISAKDQSEGIPASEIPRLTERFYRIDKSRSRNAGGTGLGLAIVKHIVSRHRGKLDIQSVVGEGSDFRVFLPVPEKL